MDEPNYFQLIGYLEEALPAPEMARIEERLRNSDSWRRAFAEIRENVDSGEHSIATIWRRHRLTCPSREQLGAYVVGALPAEEEDYIRFHLETIACRWCSANLDDVRDSVRATAAPPDATKRRTRIFTSSVGCLSRKRSK